MSIMSELSLTSQKEYHNYLATKSRYLKIKQQLGGSAYDWYKVCEDNKWVQYSDADRDTIEEYYRTATGNIFTTTPLSNGDTIIFDKTLKSGLMNGCRVFRNCRSMGDISVEYMEQHGGAIKVYI